MTADTIRRATLADLPRIYDIWYASEVEGVRDPPARGNAADFRHELETGEMCVAERSEQIIGFAAALTRSSATYLAELFVAKAYQSSGVGKRLLGAVLPQDGRIIYTLSSRDPRALTLYVRAGMQPRWPHLWLRALAENLNTLPASAVEVIVGQGDDPLIRQWDSRISGRDRSLDYPFWIEQRQAVPLWFRRQGQLVGYGFAHRPSPDSLWYPDALTLGPIGTLAEGDAIACVLAAVHWARQEAAVLRLALPGPHPALPLLLAHGFQITYVETFVSSSTQPLFDPRCYVSSGGLGL
jgi:GNAT superfamily N-acetyltransferase